MPYRFESSCDVNGLAPGVATEFQAFLQCARCAFIKVDGTRCKNRVCIGRDLCWQHNLKQYNVRIKESLVPGAGKGLFAMERGNQTNSILFRNTAGRTQNNAWICPYNGEIIDEALLDERYGLCTAPYAIRKDDTEVFEDAAVVRGVGAMANQGPVNAELLWRGEPYNSIWLKCKRGRVIRNGDELLINYGEEYDFQDTIHSTKYVRN